ncbi:ENV1 protein, partial [Crocuta crocuta]
WWACSTGLTPCVHGTTLNNTKSFCVLVQLVPRILYHTDEELFQAITGAKPSKWTKREPFTALTLSVLLGLGLAGTGTGISALAVQSSSYNHLRAAIDMDIQNLETSVAHLQKSLTSLAEVVLQNRRELDLLLLQQGGLCAELKEECCFYADHSGVIKESLAKVQEGLAKRKREREQSQGWFESWFNSSPWLTTLISTLLGPLLILVFILTFRRWVLNRLVTFIKKRINTVQI